MTTTTTAPPTLDAWRALFAAMAQLKETAPWQWMHDLDCFAICNPEQPDETVYCTVLGRMGEHLGISAFVGPQGFASYLGMNACGPELPDSFMTELDCFMLSFDDRAGVEPCQKPIFKQLGLTYRGRNAWPVIRRFRPGTPATAPTAADLRFSMHIIEQSLDVAHRFRANATLLPALESGQLLTRVPCLHAGQVTWQDSVRATPAPPAPPVVAPVPPPPALLDQVRQACARTLAVWECDCRIMHVVIGNDNEPGCFPQLLACVQHATGHICGFELLEPSADWHAVPAAFLKQCLHAGTVPEALLLCNPTLACVLAPTLAALHIAVQHAGQLPLYDVMFADMQMFLQQGPPRAAGTSRRAR